MKYGRNKGTKKIPNSEGTPTERETERATSQVLGNLAMKDRLLE